MPNVSSAHAGGHGWSLWINGRWPILILKTLGGKPEQIAVSGCDLRKVSSSCGVHVTLCEGLWLEYLCSGPLYGELSGGNRIAREPCAALLQGVTRCGIAWSANESHTSLIRAILRCLLRREVISSIVRGLSPSEHYSASACGGRLGAQRLGIR